MSSLEYNRNRRRSAFGAESRPKKCIWKAQQRRLFPEYHDPVNQDDIHIFPLSRQGGWGGRHRNDIHAAAIFPLISGWKDKVGVYKCWQSNKLWSFHPLHWLERCINLKKYEKMCCLILKYDPVVLIIHCLFSCWSIRKLFTGFATSSTTVQCLATSCVLPCAEDHNIKCGFCCADVGWLQMRRDNGGLRAARTWCDAESGPPVTLVTLVSLACRAVTRHRKSCTYGKLTAPTWNHSQRRL